MALRWPAPRARRVRESNGELEVVQIVAGLDLTQQARMNIQVLRRAIELSETKYCSVYNTLKHGVDLSSDFEIENE